MGEKNRLIYFSDMYFSTKAEKAFLEAHMSVQLIPTPEQLHHACGLCILVCEDDLKEALRIMRVDQITYSGIYTYYGRKEPMEKVSIES